MFRNECSGIFFFEVIGVIELQKEILEELERTTFLLNEVIEIYEQHQGEPEEKPAINCPSCRRESTNYVCDWFGTSMSIFIVSVAVVSINK